MNKTRQYIKGRLEELRASLEFFVGKQIEASIRSDQEKVDEWARRVEKTEARIEELEGVYERLISCRQEQIA